MEKALYFLDKSFWLSPRLVILFIITIFLIVFVRYILISITYQKWLDHFHRKTTSKKRASNKNQQKREVLWSMLSSLIFAVLSVIAYWTYQQGHTQIYTDVKLYGIYYFIISIVVVLFLYETYYYWLHRWMHRPSIFKIVHKVHHESKHTSVFTSFSFHPWESVLQFIFLPIIVIVMPLHYLALAIVLMFMTISAIINHAGVEIFPKNFIKHPLGKYLIGSTHHSLHHTEFKSNFGLYFTFWDRWMKTESSQFKKHFVRNTTEEKE